jgi:uncharacterized protein YndB with AHSA1/START domain
MAETTDTSLVVRRVFETSPQKLWQIWTKPEIIKQWHHPPGFNTTIAESDAKVGGKYKIAMKNKKTGEMSVAYGEFLEVDKPNKLVFSWAWEHNPQEKSKVTVEFRPYDDDTELVLTHERLSGPESVKLHAGGWESMLPAIEELTKT